MSVIDYHLGDFVHTWGTTNHSIKAHWLQFTLPTRSQFVLGINQKKLSQP
jgi:hypothetical protein